MAAKLNTPDLWQFDDDASIRDIPDLKRVVIDDAPKIASNIDLKKAGVWMQLTKYQVVDDETKDDIKEERANRKMCAELLSKIKTVRQLRGLFIALVEDNQGFIVKNLGWDPEAIKERARHPGKQPEMAPATTMPQMPSSQLTQAIKQLLDPNKTADIISRLLVGHTLVACMSPYLSQDEMQQISHPGNIDNQKAVYMLDIIKRKRTEAQKAFIEALQKTNQSGVLEIIGL